MLGCAGSSYDPSRKVPCSSYLCESPSAAVLLDCGFGSFASSWKNARATRLDAIVLSHAHRDHAFDVGEFVASASAWRERPRVIASGATFDSLDLDEREVEEIVVEDGDHVDLLSFGLDFSLTTHQIPTLAIQVSANVARIVYGADTGPGWEVPMSFRGPDLAILECTIDARDASSSPFHLDADELVLLSEIIDPRTTMVTHVPPGDNERVRLERAKRAAPHREFLLATTGLRLVV